MTTPYGEGPCSCPESLWLRALLTGIVTADTEQGLADAVAAAASAMREEQDSQEVDEPPPIVRGSGEVMTPWYTKEDPDGPAS